jgi:hypothetical protein
MHSRASVCQPEDSSASDLGAQISICLRPAEPRERRYDQETVQTGLSWSEVRRSLAGTSGAPTSVILPISDGDAAIGLGVPLVQNRSETDFTVLRASATMPITFAM